MAQGRWGADRSRSAAIAANHGFHRLGVGGDHPANNGCTHDCAPEISSPFRPHATAVMIPGMAIAFAIFGVAFVAFCVWLTVRIVNRRERLAKWTAGLVGLPVLYVLSFGPACWLTSRTGYGASVIAGIYKPIVYLRRLRHGMPPRCEEVGKAIEVYAELGAANDWMWVERLNDDTGGYEPAWINVFDQ